MKAKPLLRPVWPSSTTWTFSKGPYFLNSDSSSLSLVYRDSPNTPRHLLGCGSSRWPSWRLLLDIGDREWSRPRPPPPPPECFLSLGGGDLDLDLVLERDLLRDLDGIFPENTLFWTGQGKLFGYYNFFLNVKIIVGTTKYEIKMAQSQNIPTFVPWKVFSLSWNLALAIGLAKLIQIMFSYAWYLDKRLFLVLSSLLYLSWMI